MKHIELLLMTIFTSQLREIVRAGRFYITVAPLYRVIKNGVDNIFLNTKKDLDVFFSKELSENFKFTDEDGKELPVKSRAKYVSKLREYRTKLEEYASKYNITPHILETGFINFFNTEEEDFEYPENIEINELPNGNITVSGFLDTGYEETFIFINADPEVLVEDLTLLQELCLESSEYSNIYNKNGKLIEAYSIYDIIVKAFDTVNKYCTVTRFKGELYALVKLF